jgi:hypothetical protein
MKPCQRVGVWPNEIEPSTINGLKRITPLAVVPEPAEPSQLSTAAQPQARKAVFRFSGEFWMVGFQDHESCLSDRKGLRYVAELLRCSGDEIRALDLIIAGQNSKASCPINRASREAAAVFLMTPADARPSGEGRL